ncbi:MAG: hypothetical protein AB1489_26565 [Acidobacteriota bacterium]
MASDQKGTLDQQYKKLVLRFKQLHAAQDTLAKIGHLPIGSTQLQSKIFAALKQLKPLISGGDPLLMNAKLSAIEAQLREYEEWIQQCNNTLTPYGLRQYINQGDLKQSDMLGFARYLSAKQSNLIDDRGKLELLLSELCQDLNNQEQHSLLAELFPEPPQLTYAVQELLEQLRTLTAQIQALSDFPQLIMGEYMARARRLKLDLGSALWHPEALSVVGALNLTLENSFRNLFSSERQFVMESCRKLLSAGINSVGKLGESGVLNVEAAARLAERADGLLEQNYQTNMQRLQQLAQIGQWLRNAVETLDRHCQDEIELPNQMVTQPRPTVERDSNLAPISTVLDYANVGAMEQQLVDRIEELAQILIARPRRSSVEVIQLKRTVLLLGEWEVASMLSLGNLVEAWHRQFYDLIRRCIALIAELQESAIVYTEGMNKKKSSYQYSVPATIYFMEQSRRAEGELETMSQLARQRSDIEMSLNLLATRSKLQDAYQKILTQFKQAGLDLQ